MRNKTKVCLVSDYLVELHPNWSGAELVVQYLSRVLKDGGADLYYLTTNPGKKVPKNIFPVPVLKPVLKKFLPLHIPIRTVAAFCHLVKKRPDIIHFFHSNSLFLPVAIAAKILRIPTTFTVLDYFILCPTGHLMLKDSSICKEKAGWNCLKCASLPRILERRVLKIFKKELRQIVTFTETSKKRLISHGFAKNKIKVKYIYEFCLKPMGSGKKIHDILFIGTFKKQKGMHVVLQSLPFILKKIPSAKLAIIGRGVGEDKERINKLVKELNIGKNVEFLGQKNNQEVLKTVAKSKVVTVAEQWFSDFGPVALVEAMAQGRPVVAANIGSAADFIKDGQSGFLAERDNPAQFAQKIVKLLQKDTLREKMGEKAKQSIREMFAGDNSKEIFNLYTKL